MKPLFIGIAVCVATIAAAQNGYSVRLGTPLIQPSVAASVDRNPAERQPTDAVLDVSMPKMYYDAGEPVILDTHLRTRRGGDLEGADITVDDQRITADPFDQGRPGKQKQRGQPHGHGRHSITLDNTPGEHSILLNAGGLDATGHPIKRGIELTYVVATGDIEFLDVVSVRPNGNALVVTLKLKVRTEGLYVITATIASGPIAVAEATRQVTIHAGVSSVDLFFNQANIVEPGPYRLVHLSASGGTAAGTLAAAPHDLGKLFTAAHAEHEPPPRRNEDGEIAGGPYGPVPLDSSHTSTIPTPNPNEPLSVIPPPPPEFGEPYIPDEPQ